jgi:hypothetical protein
MGIRDRDQNKKRKARAAREVRDTIMRLSEMCDLIGLRTYIIKRTPKGKSKEPDAWGHTRAYMQSYANPANTEPLLELLQNAGCQNDLEAVRFLLTHDEIVP